jgi:hypothetical protein
LVDNFRLVAKDIFFAKRKINGEMTASLQKLKKLICISLLLAAACSPSTPKEFRYKNPENTSMLVLDRCGESVWDYLDSEGNYGKFSIIGAEVAFVVEGEKGRRELTYRWFGKNGKRYTWDEALTISPCEEVEFLPLHHTEYYKKLGFYPGKKYPVKEVRISFSTPIEVPPAPYGIPPTFFGQ